MAFYRCVGAGEAPPKTIPITLTLTGAKNDTITITKPSGENVGVCMFNDSTSGEVTITIPEEGTELIFTSSVAKDLIDNTKDYVKSAFVDKDTTGVKVLPDGTLYWYGNKVNSAVRVTASFPNIDGTAMSFNGMTTPTPVDTSEYTTINGICDYTKDGDKIVPVLFGDTFNSSNMTRGLIINRKFTAEVLNKTGNLNIGIFLGGGISTSELSHTEYTNHENFKTSPTWGDYILDMYALWLEKSLPQGSITFEGAKADQIAVRNAYGEYLGTVSFASDSVTGTVNLPLNATYTFESLVSGYNKTVEITGAESIKVMPEHALYWYGNNALSNSFTTVVVGSGSTFTKNANSLTFTVTSNNGIRVTSDNNPNYSGFTKMKAFATSNLYVEAYIELVKPTSWGSDRYYRAGNITNGISEFDLTGYGDNYFLDFNIGVNGTTTIYAVWLE